MTPRVPPRAEDDGRMERRAADARFDTIDRRLAAQEDAMRELYRASAKMAEQVVSSAEQGSTVRALQDNLSALVKSVNDLSELVRTIEKEMVVLQLVRTIVFTAVLAAATAAVGVVWYAVTKPMKETPAVQESYEPKK